MEPSLYSIVQDRGCSVNTWNIVSSTAQIGLEQMGVYGATKRGLLGLPKSLIKEARPYNVRVTALSPGGTDTTFRAEPCPQY